MALMLWVEARPQRAFVVALHKPATVRGVRLGAYQRVECGAGGKQFSDGGILMHPSKETLGTEPDKRLPGHACRQPDKGDISRQKRRDIQRGTNPYPLRAQ